MQLAAGDIVYLTRLKALHNIGQRPDGVINIGRCPLVFGVNRVISGWTEALQLMPEGSTWEIYVPSNLAYGSRSVGGPIGPNETLIFKIHLVSIKK